MQLKVFGFSFVAGLVMLGAAHAEPKQPGTVTTHPARAFAERELDKWFPSGIEHDEAMRAYLAGTYKEWDKAKLLAGAHAPGDKANDQLAAMDNGATTPAKQKELAARLGMFFPGISGEEAARRVARGRVNWTIWTGGNDRFWNIMTQATFGSLDLLKTISDHPSLPAVHNTRWRLLGVTNEPCFRQAKGPREDRFGLWLDDRDTTSDECKNNKDPYENEEAYPGIRAPGSHRGDAVTWYMPTSADGKDKKRVDQIMPVGSFYGYATGVVGLRLFPNPDFGYEAAKKWDPVRYYNDPAYYNDPKLIRPYRVGMACAFCHVGPNPTKPPVAEAGTVRTNEELAFNNPKWENLNSNVGAQYFWVDRILFWNFKASQDNFIYQLLHTSRPGALDTSLVSSDQINNPRTMNAVYDLVSRMILAHRMDRAKSKDKDGKTTFAEAGGETLTGGELNNSQFNTVNEITNNKTLIPDNAAVLRSLFDTKTDTVVAPCVLKDCSDSVGALGALNRVYVNIGLFSEEWLDNFIPLVGGAKVTPFKISTAKQKSLYWQANENQTSDTAAFFLATTKPDKLADAPGGKTYLAPTSREQAYDADTKAGHKKGDYAKLGKTAFAVTCARCHSSKLPDKAFTFFNKGPSDPGYCNGGNYLSCWDAYWDYTKKDEFRTKMISMVNSPTFLQNNYLSHDRRVPDNLLDSNLCSPVATNGLKDNIWNDFSSSSYKAMPEIWADKSFKGRNFSDNYGPAKNIKGYDVPAGFLAAAPSMKQGETVPTPVEVPGGGRGFLRPASLISVWSTAPYLQNNSLGKFDWRGSVEGRMTSFDDSIHKLLYPETRAKDLEPGQVAVIYETGFGSYLTGIMDTLTMPSYLKIPKGYLPALLFDAIKELSPSHVCKSDATHQMDGDYLCLGPIPQGVPVNLISNINLEKNKLALAEAVKSLAKGVLEANKVKEADPTKAIAAKRDAFLSVAMQPLLNVSKCQDFVVNRGHYFGTEYAPDVIDGTYRAPDGKNRALNSDEREALIDFLKTM
jgi:hypothetical protein